MRIDFGNFRIPAVTLVANEFIDRYMPSANGEYVKVYLYLLRHAGEEVGQAEIADALELTEGDVRRALIRWQRDGRLTAEETGTVTKKAEPVKVPAPEETVQTAAAFPAEKVFPAEKSVPVEKALPPEKPLPAESVQIPDKSSVDFTKLRQNDEFTMLLYIVQRYLSRIFSQTDSETVAYLYDVLKMPAELIEYLAELCAQRGKTSLRYFESIALDWYRNGITTVEQAKAQGTNASSEEYAVMKAFGLKGRNPGTEE